MISSWQQTSTTIFFFLTIYLQTIRFSNGYCTTTTTTTSATFGVKGNREIKNNAQQIALPSLAFGARKLSSPLTSLHMAAWTGDHHHHQHQQQQQENRRHHHPFVVPNPFESLTHMWYQDCGSATKQVVHYDDDDDDDDVVLFSSFISFQEEEQDDDDDRHYYYSSSINQMDDDDDATNDATKILLCQKEEGQGGGPLRRATKWIKRKFQDSTPHPQQHPSSSLFQ